MPPASPIWNKVIKCKNVDFQENTLYRITVDISLSDVQWTLARLTIENSGGEPVEVWVPVASDRCQGGVPLQGTNFSMCTEIAMTDGKTLNNRNFSEVGIAELSLGGWSMSSLRISQW